MPRTPEARESETDVVRGTSRLMTRRFSLLMLAQACFGYAFSAFFLLPKYLASEFAADASAIGGLAAVNGVATVVSMFAMGVLVDRHGRRPYLTLGGIVMGVASMGFVWVDGVGPLIILLRLVQGIAFSMAFVAGSTLAVDQAPPERLGQAIGIFGLTMLSMNAVAPVVVETLAASHGWSLAFESAAGGAFASALLSRAVYDEDRSGKDHGGLVDLLRLAIRGDQIRAAAVIGLVGACFGTLFNFHQLYALELGLTRVQSFFVAYAIGAATARLGFGHLGDRLGRKRVASVMLVAYGSVALAMVGLAEIGLSPLGLCFGLAHGIFYPAFNAMVVEKALVTERGKAMALYNGWFNAGLAAGTLVFGVIADARGYPTVFVLAAGCIAVAFAVLTGGERFSRTRGSNGPARCEP